MKPRAKILIIAGSDSSGGAGIQADIKTITSLGGYAMTAVTAITSQNTLGVKSVVAIKPKEIDRDGLEEDFALKGADKYDEHEGLCFPNIHLYQL